MNEWITSQTALPNLHPALVHFPIALVPLAALLDLAAAAFERARDWLSRAGALIWVLTGLGAGAAYWAGQSAADSLVGVDPRVQARIGEHSDWGMYTLWAAGILAAFRILVTWEKIDDRTVLAVAGIAGIAASGLVARTADLGGELVFEHAVAVTLPQPLPKGGGEGPVGLSELPPETVESEPVGARLRETEAGGLEWHPKATDAAALGEILEILSGSEAVTAGEPEAGEPAGLPLDVDGHALLVLPGTFGDVQVDAELDLDGFEGVVALAHHAEGPDRAGLFRIERPAGTVDLLILRPGTEPEILDRAEPGILSKPVTLGIYAAGRHFRGMIAAETVVHGHAPALPEGRAGLLLDGTGRVVVRSVTVTPIDH